MPPQKLFIFFGKFRAFSISPFSFCSHAIHDCIAYEPPQSRGFYLKEFYGTIIVSRHHSDAAALGNLMHCFCSCTQHTSPVQYIKNIYSRVIYDRNIDFEEGQRQPVVRLPASGFAQWCHSCHRKATFCPAWNDRDGLAAFRTRQTRTGNTAYV